MKTFTFIPKTPKEIIKEGHTLCYEGAHYLSSMEYLYAGREALFKYHKENWFKGDEGYIWHKNWLKAVDIDEKGQYLLEGFE